MSALFVVLLACIVMSIAGLCALYCYGYHKDDLMRRWLAVGLIATLIAACAMLRASGWL